MTTTETRNDKILRTGAAPDVQSWLQPQRCAGQAVDLSYGVDEDGTAWERTIDRSVARATSYRMLGSAAATWDPINDCLDVD